MHPAVLRYTLQLMQGAKACGFRLQKNFGTAHAKAAWSSIHARVLVRAAQPSTKIFFMKSSCYKLFVMIISCFITQAAAAHDGSIKGYVHDGLTGKPLDAVNIFIKERNTNALTDGFGAFFIGNVPAGKYTVLINALGFEAITETIKVEDGITTDLNLVLKRGNVQLSDVVVNAVKDGTHSTVSGVDLKLRPVNTAQDLLRLVPGLFISQHQGGGKAEQMFLRGFDIDHGTDVNVTVDGMPVNMVSHAHGQGYADLHFVIPELVEKMDFGKGPYQIDKGNLATAGWVAFKTRNYLDNSFVKVEGGTYGYFRTVAAVNLLGKAAAARNEGAYLAGEYSYNRSYFDRPQNFNRLNLTGKYTRQIDKNKLFSILATGFNSYWDASGQIPERAVADGTLSRFGEVDKESGRTGRYNINAQYEQSINRHSTFKTNLYAGYYDFSLYSNFTFFLKDTVNGDQIHQAEQRIFGGYNAEYTNTYKLAGLDMKTTAGLGIRSDNTTNSELSHTRGMNEVLERLAYGDIRETNIFGYLNQTIYLLPSLVLNAGTRFDYFIHNYEDHLQQPEYPNDTKTANAFSPKLGLYYNFGREGRLYFNYGTGFHTNDTRVVVRKNPSEILPLAQSFDLGFVVKPYSKLLLSGAVFMLNLEEEFVYVGDEAVIEAGGRTRRIGADLSVRYDVLRWLYLDVDLNYTHGRSIDEPAGADYIPLAPRFTTIGGLTYKNKGPWSGSLRYRHLGDRAANEDNTVVAPGYTVFDAAVNYIKPHYEFGLQVQNLFNTNWNEAQFDTETRLRNEAAPVSEICFTPGTPFFIKLTAAYKF